MKVSISQEDRCIFLKEHKCVVFIWHKMSEPPPLLSLLWSLAKRHPREGKLLILSTYFAFLLVIALYVPCHDATMGGEILPWISYRYIFGEFASYCQIDLPRVVLETVGLTAALGIAFVVLKIAETRG